MKTWRGYRGLQGPEQLLLEPGRRVRTPAEFLAWQIATVENRGGRVWSSPAPTVARVNHGRWIADCVWCKSGMFTRPDWGVAYCGECGARYPRGLVHFPDNAAAIAAVLCRRVQRSQQNWGPRQTLADLEAENRKPECLVP